MKIGNIRIVRGQTVEEIMLEDELNQARYEEAAARHKATLFSEFFWPPRASVEMRPPNLTPERRAEIVRAFGRIEASHPLLVAFLELLDVRLGQVRAVGSASEMANHHGDLAHSAGGACWLETLRTDIQRAYNEAHSEKKVGA
jgi:hypothetical protein